MNGGDKSSIFLMTAREMMFHVLMPGRYMSDAEFLKLVGLEYMSTVDHPSYYGGEDNPCEAIKVIEAHGLDFCLGNVLTYILRAGKKDPATELEDLEKARWYLDRRITQIRKDSQ